MTENGKITAEIVDVDHTESAEYEFVVDIEKEIRVPGLDYPLKLVETYRHDNQYEESIDYPERIVSVWFRGEKVERWSLTYECFDDFDGIDDFEAFCTTTAMAGYRAEVSVLDTDKLAAISAGDAR